MGFDAALEYLDNPIESLEQDELSRGGYVENVCRILRTPTITESNVFAIYGDWGAGKTSVKNLIIKHWKNDKEAPLTIEFNPWAFSSQKEVMTAFFQHVSHKIGSEQSGKALAK
jgi:predicted KAP-like P-loop ATPase